MSKLRKLILCLAVLTFTVLAILPSFAQGTYTDVSDDAWYADAVKYVTENNVMNKTSNSKFSPELVVNRAMLATILYRMSGSPSSNKEDNFTDTKKDTWYSNAVIWASSNGIIDGFGNKIFAPDKKLNCEQLMSIIWRFAGKPTVTQVDASYDYSNVSSWAKSAVLWSSTNGIMAESMEKEFKPKENVTRAELAVVLTNYLKKYDTKNVDTKTKDDKIINNNNKENYNTKGKKTLVVYYSQTGSTRNLAEFIAKEINADLFELKPNPAYSDADVNWTNQNSRVVKEHNEMPNVKVELENTKVPDFEIYDTVFIGAPIWWGELAWVVDDFVKDNDFTGKKLVAFSTSISTGDSQSGKRLEEYTKDVQWLKGERFSSNFNEDDVKKWLETLN